MDDRKIAASFSTAPALIVALLQGLLLWWLFHTKDFGAWPGNSRECYAPLLSFAILIGPTIYAFMPWWKRPLAWGILALMAMLFLGSGWEFGNHAWAPGTLDWRVYSVPFPLFLLQLLILFHAVPFLQGYLREGHWRFGYRVLFLDTWQNALRLALAGLFTSVFWLLLWLWAELFRMIGLPFAGILLFSVPGYSSLVVALAFGVGFLLVDSSERLLTAVRQQVLTLLKWLLPVAALIVAAFSVALAFRAHALLAEHHHVIRAVWLLWLVIVSVYLYNAAYQDGSIGEPYPRQLGRAIRWATPLLLLLGCMAAYDLWVRIDAYGLTSSRYWGVIVAGITLVYAVGYSAAALGQGYWMAAMGRANVRAALLIIVVLTLTLTPTFSPTRLSANSQAARLAHSAGVAGPGDFMALRFDAGAYGYMALARLAAQPGIAAAIRDGARAALDVKDARERWKFKYTTVPSVNVALEAFPAGSPIDTDLRKKILAELPAPPKRAVSGTDAYDAPMGSFAAGVQTRRQKLLCSADLPCPVLFVDLHGDGRAEAIAFLPVFAIVFEKGGDGWTQVGKTNWQWRLRPDGKATASDLLTALQAGDYRVTPPRWKALQIGRDHLPLDLPEGPTVSDPVK